MISVEELEREIADLAAHLDAATHRLLECIRQFDESNQWAEQGAVSCAHWLSWRIGLDLATAREKVRVARALGKLHEIDQAFREGKLSYAKVRALSRVGTPENEANLLALAVEATGAQLERLCRGYRNALVGDQPFVKEERSVRRRDLPGGMVKLEIVLQPDEADLVLRAMDRAREARHADLEKDKPDQGKSSTPDVSAETCECDHKHNDVSAESSDTAEPPVTVTSEVFGDSAFEKPVWPSRVDGMVTLALEFLSGSTAHGNGGERYQVMIHVDQDPLAPDGVVAATLEDGTRVSAETLRRVACGSGLVAVTGAGENLNIGRRSRAIPPAIWRTLLIRDHGCRFPGCTHTRFLHGHHVQHWLHGGETSVSNVILLCTAHHHLVHEGGFKVAWTSPGKSPDESPGDLVFTAPSGRILTPEPPAAITEDILLWLRERANEQGVDIGPDSNFPQWDGTRPDYDWAINALISAA